MKVFLINILIIFSVLSISNTRILVPGMNIRRELQAKQPAKGKDFPENPHAAPNPHKPLVLPVFTDNWKKERDTWFTEEKKRLDREKAFHTSEFNRYNRQQKWNEDRKKVETDESKTVSQRVLELRDMDEQAWIDIDDINAHVNYKQNMRNPANREEDRAWRIFNEALNREMTSRTNQLKGVKIPPQPVAVVKRRNLQAKTSGYTQAQTKAVQDLKALWEKRRIALQAQIDLNLKFHTMEFKEFQLDSNRREDLMVIWNSDLPLHEKRDLQNIIWRQYDAVKNPIKNLINQANNTRAEAQNVVNGLENQYTGLVRNNKNFSWATKK